MCRAPKVENKGPYRMTRQRTSHEQKIESKVHRTGDHQKPTAVTLFGSE